MHRMGHGSMRAALIYRHVTSERDRSIAAALSALVAADRAATAKRDEADKVGGDQEDGPADSLVSDDLMAR
jgi:hypothetical protein